MPSFIHPLLLWGLPLVAVPVLIHLINMMRHRRIEWAAMEFLLVSQRRNRTWVLLKQLLLLLLRMTAVAGLVFMVAQPLFRNQLGSVLGASKTHHIVLMDDSFSMADSWATTNAFDRAKQVVERIAAHAAGENSAQSFTLLRFSKAGRSQPDLTREEVDSDFQSHMQEVVKSLTASELAIGPSEALEAVTRVLGDPEDETRVLYLVSDFRAKEWKNPEPLVKRMTELADQGTHVRLVNCVTALRSNLAIASLEPAPGTRAVEVPFFMEVSVTNFGQVPARNVAILLEEDGQARPGVDLEEIGAGETATRRFLVHFPTAGQHRIMAQLQGGDAVATDNVRHAVVDLPLEVPVLIVDGEASAANRGESDSYFLSTALAPGGSIKTGIKTRIESPRFLRDANLAEFQSIYLLNIPRLDPAEITALEEYVRGGGGLAFFMGELSRADFFNESLHRDGEGLFPVKLSGPTDLLVDRLDRAPDLEVEEHPIFKVFAGERNSFINSVIVERYFAAPKEWAAGEDSPVKVIARLRNGAPLAVEQPFGDGRVVAVLTTAAPRWNNWGRGNPSFVVAMLDLQSYLTQRSTPARIVGTPLEMTFDRAKYQAQGRFQPPQGETDGMLLVEGGEASEKLWKLTFPASDMAASGIYEVQLNATDGQAENRLFAVNVLPEEGNLERVDGSQLAIALEDVRGYEYLEADDLEYQPQELGGFNLSKTWLFMLALIGLMLGEQMLAYSASYHRPAKEGAR